MANKDRCSRYRQKLKERVWKMMGMKCRHPDCLSTDDLHLAHVDATPLSGTGSSRGMTHRFLDVLKHPHCYTILCRPHHIEFDNRDVLWEPLPD
jgi:hypothetical protein